MNDCGLLGQVDVSLFQAAFCTLEVRDHVLEFQSAVPYPLVQLFIMFPEQETTEDLNDPRHVTVLLNFFDEVRRRVPGGK